jgi:hypothetical protein
MARPSSHDPIEPMDLANMRRNGVRSLAVCRKCAGRYFVRPDFMLQLVTGLIRPDVCVEVEISEGAT